MSDRAIQSGAARSSGAVRLGCLPYLNVKPLVYPFEHGQLPVNWDIVYATPSRLAAMLDDHRIDIAPVSSFACLANPKLSIVPGICIASYGPVMTVLMLSKTEPEKVKSVAADTSSLSGRALLRILLSENYSVEPMFVDCEPDSRKMLENHDAALIIGNPAMLCDKTGLHVLDIGEEWRRLTGLPAVFAVWAGPEMSISREMIEKLAEAKEIGLPAIPEIAADQSAILGVPRNICEEYLSEIMKYDLREQEICSLKEFGRLAHKHGLIPSVPDIRVVEG